MSEMMRSLGLDRLSTADRLSLIEELWDSVAASTTEREMLTDPQKADLKRRLGAYMHNPGAGSTWEDVKRRLTGDVS